MAGNAAYNRAAINTLGGGQAVTFGTPATVQLPNSSAVNVTAVSLNSVLETSTAGAEDGSLTVQAIRAGVLTTLAKFNGKAATGNYPLELSALNADNVGLAFTNPGLTEIHKTGAGILRFRLANNAIGQEMGFYTFAYPGIRIIEGGGGYSDVVLGPNQILNATASNGGYVYLPLMNTVGAPTGAPAAYTGSIAYVHNTADHKLYAYDTVSAAWLSQTLIQTPTSILAALTNNCTASGTTGTIPNWTSLSVYATDAQAIHDAVSQLAKKVVIMETALRLNTSMAIT